MENSQDNYFDKFMVDLEKREDVSRQQKERLKKAEAAIENLRERDRRYREQPNQRIRYER